MWLYAASLHTPNSKLLTFIKGCVKMSDTNARKYNLADFFSNYFAHFGQLLLVNLLFCLPLAIYIGAAVLLTKLLGELSWFVMFLVIPLMSPFFAGLTNVCRKLTANQGIEPVKDYFTGIRQNWLFFLVNSIFLYALTAGMFVIIALNRGTGGNGAVLAYMIIMLITSLVFILMDFSALVMAVSVELRYADIIKNSLVLIGKGLVNHLKTVFALLFVSFLLYTTVVLIQQYVVSMIVIGVLTLVFLPTLLMYTITYNAYQTIEKHIILPYSSEQQRIKRLQEEKKKDELLTVEDLEPLAEGDPEEYVFLNGKTVKRKTVLKMLEVKRQQTS